MRMKIILSIAVIVGGMAVNAANFYVKSGETRTVSVAGGLSGDNISHRVYVEDGGIVKLTNPPTTGEATLYNFIICSNGTVTVDVTDCAGRAVRLAHGVRALGELKIVGANEISFGRSYPRGTTGLSVFDCPKVTFYEANEADGGGTGLNCSGKVKFDAPVTLVSLPCNDGTTYEISSGIEVALCGSRVFGDLDIYELGDFDTIILDSEAFRPGSLLKVAAGRTLAVKPCYVSEDLLWIGKKGNITNNVELLGEESTLSFRSTGDMAFYGNIGGRGRIIDEFSGTASIASTLVGDISLNGCVEATRTGYEFVFEGGSFDGANITATAVDGAHISFKPQDGTCSLSGIGKNVSIEAGAEACVNASVLPEGAAIAATGGTVNLELDLMSWTNQVGVTLWLDPNDAASLHLLEDPSGKRQEFEDYNVVEKWWDCRLDEAGDRYAYNNRAYLNGSWTGGLSYVYPRFVPAGGDGPNGLAYLYTSKNISSSAGRLYLFDDALTTGSGSADTAKNSAKFTIMVFGSQYGGGTAMIGGIDSPFLRAGDGKTATKDTGILKDDTHPVWLDGERITDPTTTGFSGGWQIVSLQNGNDAALFLGWRNQYSNYAGGQQYGEIIFLDEIPSDEVRKRIEYYLAVKWGLDGQLKSSSENATLKVTAQGEGSLSVIDGSTLELSGAFAGSIKLNGSDLVIVDNAIPKADELPKQGQVAWFDPDSAETVILASEPTKSNLICGIYDREPSRRSGTGRMLYIAEPNGVTATGKDRCPYLHEGDWSLPFAPIRHWIDNNDLYNDTAGNALRLRLASNRQGSDSDGALKVRTVILVQNSERGGGTPILGNYSGETGVTRTTPTPGAALWQSSANDALKNAKVYVNGKQSLDPLSSSGFGGRPEVLSIETASDYSVSSFGYYGNSENRAQGEIFGEILLYSRVLSVPERESIEAYLQRKWLGTIRDGYSDIRESMAIGGGRVTAPTLAALPKMDSGEAAIASDVLNFTLVGGANSHLANPVNLGNATLMLPEATTVAVTLTARPEYGVYRLVTANSVVAERLDLEVAGDVKRIRTRLVRDGSGIALSVEPLMTAIFVRL